MSNATDAGVAASACDECVGMQWPGFGGGIRAGFGLLVTGEMDMQESAVGAPKSGSIIGQIFANIEETG